MKRNKEWEQSQPDIKTKKPDSFSSPTEAKTRITLWKAMQEE
jgi:hypothetical protein